MRRAALLMLSLCACVEPELVPRTQVVAAVYADPGLSSRLARVDVEVRDESGAELVNEHRFELGTSELTLPLSFGVYQPSGGADWFMLIARGVDAMDSTLVERKVIAQFLKGKTGLLHIVLSDDCVGTSCEDGQTCDLGRCVPVSRVVPELQPSDGGIIEPPSMTAAPVPPSSHGFGSLGSLRTDGTISVYGDGFELAERRCTVDGQYCVTGSLRP